MQKIFIFLQKICIFIRFWVIIAATLRPHRRQYRGMGQLVARQGHSLECVGSIPAPATKEA